MTHFTAEMIAAAKENDLSAITALISETEDLVTRRASDYATSDGWTDHALADDLAQVGRVRIWESVAKFEGTEPGEFMAFISRALHSAMTDHRREERFPGVDVGTVRDFRTALILAGGDPYEAARVAATDAMGARRMVPDRARAALLSWLGTDRIDRPVTGEGEDVVTLADVIADEVGVPVDLLDPHDAATVSRRTIRKQVHAALGKLSDRQRHVLKADHGIAPVGCYANEPLALASDMGLTLEQVRHARRLGKSRFAGVYLAETGEASGAA
ncbi:MULTISPECIES: sigma factor [unclassified Streptomyces]|uniref:sigma factor n=1 Tax=unclassified Streptomyces TaxID=2593676 RepID=UPI0038117F5A